MNGSVKLPSILRKYPALLLIVEYASDTRRIIVPSFIHAFSLGKHVIVAFYTTEDDFSEVVRTLNVNASLWGNHSLKLHGKNKKLQEIFKQYVY